MTAIKHSLLLLLILSIAACKKENDTITAMQTESITVYAEPNILWAAGSVAGDGVVLLVYVDYDKQYKFKLIDNYGKEIWTKTFGYLFDPSNFIMLQVIYDADNTFAIFSNNGLKKIDMEGNIVFNNDNFLNVILNQEIHKIILGNNDTYLVLGTANNRAFVSEISKEGLLNFYKLYVVNVNGPNGFTGAEKTSTGGYIAAGAFASNTEGLQSSFFIMELAANGNIIKVNKTEIDSCACQGRDFIKLAENSYAYVVSPSSINSKEKRSRIYKINDTASILTMNYLDLTENNYGAGYSPYFGNGLIKNSSGSLYGIMKSAYEVIANSSLNNAILPNFTKPQFDYNYSLDANATHVSQAFLNKNYSNYFNSILNMSNGKVLLFGATLSLGDELRLITIIK